MKYKGIVKDIDDPVKMGRIKVYVPAIHGGDDSLMTDWAMPSVPFSGDGIGMIRIPPVDSFVWIEFEQDNLDKTPIWSGGFWVEDKKLEEIDKEKLLLVTEKFKIVIDNDKVNISGEGGEIEISGNVVKINGDTDIELNGNSHSAVLYDMLNTALQTFVSMLSSHTHLGNMGAPTGPPIPTPTLNIGTAESQKVKIGG